MSINTTMSLSALLVLATIMGIANELMGFVVSVSAFWIVAGLAK